MELNNEIVNRGFHADCSTLIHRFGQLETVRYEGFCTVWQEMKFSHVFSGRLTYNELREFGRDCLTIAKEFFLPPLSFKERIGGLYLLYGLYFEMPVDGPKINLTMTEWQDTLEFRAEICQAEHHDASYILAKLMADNAFNYSLASREFGLEKNYCWKIRHAAKDPYSVLPELLELINGEHFKELNELSKQYRTALRDEADVVGSSTSSSTGDSQRRHWSWEPNVADKLANMVRELETPGEDMGGDILRNLWLRRAQVDRIKRRERKSKDAATSDEESDSDSDAETKKEKDPRSRSEPTKALPDIQDDSASSQ